MEGTTQSPQTKRVSWIIGSLILIVGVGFMGFPIISRLVRSSSPSETQFSLPNAMNKNEKVMDLSSASGELWSDETPTPVPSPIIVYISGAVHQPDVYELPYNARVKDAVIAAGGLTSNANLEHINLAARLRDAEHIKIPSVGEIEAPLTPDQISSSKQQSVVTKDELKDGLIDINTASEPELEKLHGIGKTLANRIVVYRSTNGPFASVEELQKVRGISSALIEDIRPYVTIGQ